MMNIRECSMCPYKAVFTPEVGFLAEELFYRHIDEHCSDFRIELELMSL